MVLCAQLKRRKDGRYYYTADQTDSETGVKLIAQYTAVRAHARVFSQLNRCLGLRIRRQHTRSLRCSFVWLGTGHGSFFSLK